jgi:hypothetical protein
LTTHHDEYRSKLIEAVRRTQAQQEARELTDQQLEAIICSQLGLPPGATFTDEQLEMVAKHR